MARPATAWARGTGERTDLDPGDCLPEGCDPATALVGTVWLGDGTAIVPEDPDCVGTDEGGPCLDRSLDIGPGGPESDAIVRPRLLWSNGYEIEGQVFRVGQNPGTPDPSDFSTVGEVTGGFVFHATGGRDNGGYVETVESAPGMTQADNVGNYMWLPLAPGETPPRGAGQHHAFNYHGVALPRPHNAIGFGSNTGTGPFFPSVVLQVSDADRKVRVMKVGVDMGGLATFTQLGPTSTLVVPADGWWSIEPQAFVAPGGNTEGGFVIARYYHEGGPAEGETIVFALGVNLTGDGHHGYAWGSEVVRRNSVGISGVWIDDSVVYGPYGPVKRWLGDCRVGVGVPSGAGDATNSEVAHTSSPHPLGVTATDMGVTVTHGSTDRWRNVTGAIARAIDEITSGDWWLGQISAFTGAWLFGPLPFPTSDPTVAAGWNDWTADELMPRNTLYDELSELYRTTVNRTNIAVVEGLFPYLRAGARWVVGVARFGPASDHLDGTWAPADGLDATTMIFPLVSRHAHGSIGSGSGILGDGADAYRHDLRTLIKAGGATTQGAIRTAVRGAPNPLHQDVGSKWGTRWNTLLGYTVAPYDFVEANPATSARFEPSDLPAVQAGFKGDLSRFDANFLTDPDFTPEARWNQLDVVEAGFDVVYHPEVVAFTEHAPFPPVAAFFTTTGTDLPARHVVIRDASTDWDGSLVTLLVDWGDGSDPEPIAAGGTLAHDYAAPGTYTITLTVLDSDSLADSVSHDVDAFIPNTPPSADFTVAADPGDITNQTVGFTDTSVDDGTITAWDWDFGDGSPHDTTQNPVHVYAAPGTYTVVLVVTDDGGEGGQPPLTGSTSVDIDLPLAGGGGGSRVSMPILFSDSTHAGLQQSSRRYDFTGGGETLAAGAGRDGRDAIAEGDNFGTWQYTFRVADPHVFQFAFDLQGATLPGYELPLFVAGAHTLACVLRPDGKVRVYAWDGVAWNNVMETAAPVPGTGWVVGTMRFGYGAIGAGFAKLRINGEVLSADPIAVNPGGGSFVNDFITFGTGSGGNYDYAPPGYVHGLAAVRWCDIACFDDSGVVDHDDHPGDVHFSIATPQAVGTFNDSGGSAVNVQVADEGTSKNTFTALSQKDTFTLDTPSGTIAAILAVLPFFEVIRGGASVTRTFAMLVKSGGGTSQSADISSASSYSARYRVNPSDTQDRWAVPLDPSTGLAWAAAAAVGAAEVGMVVTVLGAGGTISVSQLGLEVAYWDV